MNAAEFSRDRWFAVVLFDSFIFVLFGLFPLSLLLFELLII